MKFFKPGQGEVVFDWLHLWTRKAEPPEAWSVPEAFYAILFAAVVCDEDLAAVERAELLALMSRSRALKSLSVDELRTIDKKVRARFLRDDYEALQQACAALPEEARLPAFAHALDLVLADGTLNEDEADFLNALILNLNLDREGVERIADVIALKNRF